LLSDLKMFLERESLQVWTNGAVPANDGGISLGQAALGAFGVLEVIGTVDENKDSVERAA
jgi:hydrogenase maturation factor HypF (carbamoyltransferase family)